MATSDQLTRLAARQCDYQVAVYIGGLYGLANVSNIGAGGAYTPTVSTTLTASVDEDDTEINVTSTTGFTTGIIIIHADDNEYDEVIAYSATTSTKFQQLTRNQTDPTKKRHSNGAAVSEWRDITSIVTGPISLNIDDDGPVVDWKASLKGIDYCSSYIQNDAAVLVMWRFRPNAGSMASFTSWEVAFVGFITDLRVDKDKKWSCNICSIGRYVAETDIDAGEYGKIDLAYGKSVTVSSYLQDPLQESGSGEYLGSPDLSGDNIVDNDMGTLWISADVPSSTPETPSTTGWTINEVCLEQPPWVNDNLQWIELHYKHASDNGSLNSMAIVSRCTTWRTEQWWDENTQQFYDVRLPNTNFIPLGAVGGEFPDDGSFALLVSNLPLFLQLYPHYAGQFVMDWRGLAWGTFELEPGGDFISLRFHGTTIEDEIWWDGGEGGWAIYDYDGDSGTSGDWSGAMIDVTSLPAGHTFRRDPTGYETSPDVAGNFENDEDMPTPGYRMTGDPEYAAVDIGVMGIVLEQELSSGETGVAYLSGTVGLTVGSAYIKLDSEIIQYATIDRDNDQLLTLTRGCFATTPATHPVDTVVYQYTTDDDVASNAHLISQVIWRRRNVLDSNGDPIVPKNFDIFATTYSSPCYPDDAEWDDGLGSGGWEDYWKRVATVREFEDPVFYVTFEATRAITVMITIYDMSDGERAKLNEFEVYSATTEVDLGDGGTGWIEGRWTGEIIKYILVEQFGLPSANFTFTAPGRQFLSVTTTKGSALSIIRDLCERTGSQIVFNLDYSAELRYNPRYPLYELPDIDVTWDDANARAVDYSRDFQHDVRQVLLRAANLETDEAYSAVFPATPLPLGSDHTIQDAIIGNEDDASLMAQRIFLDLRLPNEATIVPVGLAEFVRPGDRHVIDWIIDEDNTHLSGRNFVIISASYDMGLGKVTRQGIEQKSWDASFRLKEVNYAPAF